jgi:hypothetical protein
VRDGGGGKEGRDATTWDVMQNVNVIWKMFKKGNTNVCLWRQ